MTTVCEQLEGKLSALFTCTPGERYTRVRTPYLYPDGDVIDVFLREQHGELTLTDLGESLRWLRMQSAALQRTPKQRALIQDVLLNHGVELFKGMLVLKLSGADDLAAGITRLSQAALRLADLYFTFRIRSVETMGDEVSEFLTERKIPFGRAEKQAGRSGRVWTVDFHTRIEGKAAFVNLLSTGSRARARTLAETVVTEWLDLSHLLVGSQINRFITLFDDTLDVWSPEDYQLVELHSPSELAFWTRPDDFIETLAA